MDANGRKILRVFSLSLLFCWRPRRDLNPCYRPESGSEPGKLLKSGGMDSAARHFQASSEPLIGRLLEQRSAVLGSHALWNRCTRLSSNLSLKSLRAPNWSPTVN